MVGMMFPSAGGAEAASAMKQKLSAIRIPAISLTGCTMSDLVSFLNAQLGKRKSDVVMEYKLSPGESSAPVIPKLYLKDASIDEILEQGCKEAGCAWYVEENMVMVHSANLLITKTYPIEFGKLYVAYYVPGQGSAKDMLMEAGLAFPRDATAEFDAAGKVLTLVNRSREHDKMKAVLDKIGNLVVDADGAKSCYKRYYAALKNVAKTVAKMKIRDERSVEKRLVALREKLQKASEKNNEAMISYWLYTHDDAREKLNKAAEECYDAIGLLQGELQPREMDRASAIADTIEKNIRRIIGK